MDKGLLLKGLKIGVLVLFALGFLFTYISVSIFGLTISTNALKIDDATVFIIIFYVLAAGAIALMFLKPELERKVFLAILGIGLLLAIIILILVFSDAETKAMIEMGVKVNVGFGFYWQVLMVIAGVGLEFYGKKLLKVE